MNKLESDVKNLVRINTLAKSIQSEAAEMGFKSSDYVKLMNEILDMTINEKRDNAEIIDKTKKKKKILKDLPIQTKHLTIRKFDSSIDTEIVSNWFTDANNRLFLLSTTTKQDIDISKFESDENNIFAMITMKDSKPIGLLALLHIDRLNSKGEMRKMIGEVDFRGKGYAKEATEVWLKYCTEFIGLRKIYINTIETNIKNITLNRQLGFKIEGLLKHECVIDDVDYDVLRMAFIRQ
jgi:RimJ/RimL family protein N-acetyltransferase